MMEKYQAIKNKVSVVTPVYNGEAYVGRLLESVLGQTWDQIEMILVDDGSTDKTLEVARAYEEKFRQRGFSYRIVQGEHHSASAAINRGLPWVTGEFLIWPDSDDVLERDSVRKRAEFLQANPQYECVRSLSYYVDEQGERTKAIENQGDLDNERLFFPILEWETFVCCGCYMLRTERFFEIYPERKIPEYEVGQNFQMLLPMLYAHPCPTIREELYVVCVREESHSRRKLSQEEKERRYALYEDLIDEIAQICRMTDKKDLRRIRLWKQKRRYAIYSWHGKRKKAAAALVQVLLCGGVTVWEFAKGMVKIFGGERVYWLYQRLRGRKRPGERDCSE